MGMPSINNSRGGEGRGNAPCTPVVTGTYLLEAVLLADGAAAGVAAGVFRALPGFFTVPVLAGVLLDFFLGLLLVVPPLPDTGEGRKRGSSISKTGVTTDLRFFLEVGLLLSAFNCS